MKIRTMRRRSTVAPLALALSLLLAAGPALAQPGGDVPPPPEDDPGMAAQPAVDVVWFYIKDGVKLGPVTTARARQLVVAGEITTATKVWRAGMSGWLPLSALTEFADLTPPPVPETHAAPPAATASAEPEPERIRSRGMILSGSIIFGASWLAACMAAILMADARGDEQAFAELVWIPIAGPIAAYQVSDGESNTATILTVFWSLAQLTGATLFTIGMIGTANPNYKGESAWLHTPRAGDFMISPLAGGSQGLNGIGLTGVF